MTDRLNSYLDALESGLLPDLVTEYLRWYFWSHLAYAIISLALLLGSIWLIRLSRRLSDMDKEVVVVVSFGIFLFTVFATLHNIGEVVKVSTAPKVVIMDKIAEMVKSYE